MCHPLAINPPYGHDLARSGSVWNGWWIVARRERADLFFGHAHAAEFGRASDRVVLEKKGACGALRRARSGVPRAAASRSIIGSMLDVL